MTNKRFIICCLLVFSLLIIGCSRKQEDAGQSPESLSTELTLPQIPKLPRSYKPTNKEIQIALQNAGFYKGKIDGDIGPMSKKAILEFQVQNNLEVDGKVGPKTWAVLKKYLDTPNQEKGE
ncbi:MAG: peptidoglycan-binding domain-containing protein [Candidatus Omnitrophota bacterium]|jgi:peptidoglycan hydrolase-like protein with peptidoglycan-binding domain